MKSVVNSLLYWCFAAAGLFGSVLVNAETQLYETGPTDDMSYVRFVNATEANVAVTSAQGSAKIELTAQPAGRVSHYFAVKAGVKLPATVQSKDKKQTVALVGKPWEYITIVILPNGSQLKTTLVRESPTDFNAMRTSLALFNLDAKCAGATLLGGAKNTPVVENTKPFTVQRRLVNPIKLSANVSCDAKSASVPIDLAQLEAGARYSIFLLADKTARAAFFVIDNH